MLIGKLDLEDGLKKFLSCQTPNNTWLYGQQMEIYVRKSRRNINGKPLKCFDLANAEVEYTARGNGIYTRWLDFAEDEIKKAGYEAIYAENILNERMIPFYVKRGYVLLTQQEIPCAVKLFKQ